MFSLQCTVYSVQCTVYNIDLVRTLTSFLDFLSEGGERRNQLQGGEGGERRAQLQGGDYQLSVRVQIFTLRLYRVSGEN